MVRSDTEATMKKQYTFSSLGSNYDWKDGFVAIKAFFSPNLQASMELTTILQKLFPEFHATPVYKGRDALEIALKSLDVSVGDVVMTQAFSCYSVEEAIVRCGALPLYYDVQPHTLVPSKQTLDEAMSRFTRDGSNNKVIKAIIAQFTLGNTSAERGIAQWARQHQIAYVADLAQAIGCKTNGKYVGNQADAIIISTGRDKVWDGVSGGFVLTKRPLAQHLLPKQIVGVGQTLRDSIYPLLTQLIRILYPVQLGKIIHLLANRLRIFYSPIQSMYDQPAKMSVTLATFILHRWQSVLPDIEHRKIIAQQYYQKLHAQSLVNTEEIVSGANLRFPILVASTKNVVSLLRKHHIFVADRWYRQPVDGGTVNRHTLYVKGSCPHAEYAAKHCINLPTHTAIIPERATQIAQLIV